MQLQENTAKFAKKFGTNLGQFVGKTPHFDALLGLNTAFQTFN